MLLWIKTFASRLARLVLPALLIVSSPVGMANPLPKFSGLVVFGDSLSDTGNFTQETKAEYGIAFPGPSSNYAHHRFTDGAATTPRAVAHFGVWHQQLARLFLHLPPASASATGGTNYAFGLAETRDGTIAEPIDGTALTLRVTHLGQQVTDYLASHTPAAAALHLIWCGSNDLFADTSSEKISAAVQNVVAALTRLEQAGAREFLVANLPPLGDVPEYRKDGAHSAALNAAAAAFNAQLASALDSAESGFPAQDGVKIYRVDASALFQKLTAHPARGGLKNVHASAQGQPVNPDRWLFWDSLHPTTTGHYLLAVAAKKALQGD